MPATPGEAQPSVSAMAPITGLLLVPTGILHGADSPTSLWMETQLHEGVIQVFLAKCPPGHRAQRFTMPAVLLNPANHLLLPSIPSPKARDSVLSSSLLQLR